MRPDQCGNNRPFNTLPAQTQLAIRQFEALCRGELAYNNVTHEYVDPSEAAGNPDVYLPVPPGDR